LPGIIDTQVHFREPGSTDAEDLESGSRAAVLGGVTALFEMPNTNPPTSNLVEFDKKLQAAKNRMHSNYAFYFGATPDNTNQLAKLKDVEGCCGVKLFAGSSTGNLLVDKEADIEKVISSSDRIVSIHSEDEDIIKLRKKFIKKGDVHSHAEWRNVEVAMSSTRRVVKIAERYNKKILDAENAGKFVRKIFPYYYFVNLIFLSIAAILFFLVNSLQPSSFDFSSSFKRF